MKLCIPEKTLLQHIVVLGKTGAGKSSALRHMVEHLLEQNKRVCVVDPKGDWWGLKSSADGKHAGFPVIAFGGFKESKASDVPIDRYSGKHVAELIATGNRPCIIGFRGWMTADMVHFWIDFASTLFSANSGELYLVVDEFHNFAPKGKIMDPEAGKCLHWSNRLLSEGRGLGIVCLTASQRPQKVHNDSLTSHETLVAMRVIHAADRQAIKDWIDGCGDATQGKEVLNTLASLARGEAWVWSPEIGYGPMRVKFPMFETFDSFAPPQLQKKIGDSGWADVDLGAVKEKLASVIEEARANDPAELKKEIAALKKQLASQPAAAPKEVKVPDEKALKAFAEQLTVIERGIGEAAKFSEQVSKTVESFRVTTVEMHHEIQRQLAPQIQLPFPIKFEERTFKLRSVDGVRMTKGEHMILHPMPEEANGSITEPQQKIIDVIADLMRRGISPNRECVARWLDIHPNGGAYGQNLAALRAQGYIEGFNPSTTKCNPRPTQPGIEGVMAPLDGSQRRIVQVLAGNRSAVYSRDSLAAILGVHPNGGAYGQNLARLRTMGVIPERGGISILDAAFR